MMKKGALSIMRLSDSLGFEDYGSMMYSPQYVSLMLWESLM